MNKKYLYLLLILFICFFPVFVDAGEGTIKNTYGVEKFDVSSGDDKVTISGYSFVSQRDSYGILEGTSIGNMLTYVVLYTGTWRYSDGSSHNSTKIFTGGNYYAKKAKIEARNFWASLCEGEVCFDEKAILTKIKNGKYSYYNTNACNEGSRNSRCLVYNVGFKTTIDFNDVVDNFSNINLENTQLKIRIVSFIKENSSKYVLYSSDMGVYRKVCRIDGSQCAGNGSVSTANYTFQIGQMSNEAYYLATNTYIKYSDFTNVSPMNYFTASKNYYVSDVSTTKQSLVYKKPVYDSSKGKTVYYTGTVQGYVYGLRTTKTTGSHGGFVGPCNSGTCSTYYTSGDRISVTGSITIGGLKRNVIVETCDRLFPGKTVKENDVGCGEEESYKQCISDTVNAKIYFPVEGCDGIQSLVEMPDKNNYVAIDVSTNVLFNQTATFTFGNLSETEVYAGKGFGLYTTTYDNTVTWAISNRLSNGLPHYSYGEVYVEEGGSCVRKKINLANNLNTYVYYKNENGVWKKGKLGDSSFEAINIKVQKMINESNVDDIKFKSCDSNDSSECNISNPNLEVSGNWENIKSGVSDYEFKGKIFGKTITNKFEYTLGTSYVMVKGDTPAKVKYTELVSDEIEKYIDAGEKFYVDFKWTSKRDWPFNLEKDLNPSLIDDMIWKLNGTCGIKVKDGYYTSASGPGDPEPDEDDEVQFLLKYRSISLDEPFPKNVASNWQNWWNNSANKVRISNTFQYSPIYNVVLTKFDKTDAVKLSDINSINRHYIDISNMNLNGTSTFVQKYFKTDAAVVSDKSFCELGKFSTDCDLWGDS